MVRIIYEMSTANCIGKCDIYLVRANKPADWNEIVEKVNFDFNGKRFWLL